MRTHTNSRTVFNAHFFSLLFVGCLLSRPRYKSRESDEKSQTPNKVKPFACTALIVSFIDSDAVLLVLYVKRLMWRRQHPTTAEIRRRDAQHIINKWRVNEYFRSLWLSTRCGTLDDFGRKFIAFATGNHCPFPHSIASVPAHQTTDLCHWIRSAVCVARLYNFILSAVKSVSIYLIFFAFFAIRVRAKGSQNADSNKIW